MLLLLLSRYDAILVVVVYDGFPATGRRPRSKKANPEQLEPRSVRRVREKRE